MLTRRGWPRVGGPRTHTRAGVCLTYVWSTSGYICTVLNTAESCINQVRLQQARLGMGWLDDAMDDHTIFLQIAIHFFDCTKLASELSLPAEDLTTVRAYTRGLLAMVTRVLLELFTEDEARTVIVACKHLQRSGGCAIHHRSPHHPTT